MAINFKKFRVENNIFNYGLSDEDIDEMERIGKELSKLGVDVEQKYQTRKGTWVISCRNNYYRGMELNISKVDMREEQWQGKVKIAGYFFDFIPTKKEIKALKEQKEKLSKIINNTQFNNYVRKSSFKSMEDVDKAFKDALFEIDVRDEIEFSDDKGFIKELCRLFGKDYEKIKEYKKVNLQEDMRQIELVLEKNNKRFFISRARGSYSEYSLNIKSIKDNDYDYIDEGRQYLNRTYSEHPLYLFDDLKEYDVDVLREIRSDIGDIIVNNHQYKIYEKRLALKVARKQREEDIDEAYQKKIGKVQGEVEKKSFKWNDITFSKDGVEFEGLKISTISVDGKKSQKFNIGFIKSITLGQNTDFNAILRDYCRDVATSGVKVKAILGKVEVNYEPRQIETEKGDDTIYSTLHYINDKRINKDDVLDVLERAICFDNEKEYNDLVAEISKVSLKYHEALNHGLKINFHKDGNKYPMRIKMKRIGNSYNIVLPKKTKKAKERIIKLKQSTRIMNYKGGHFDEIFTMLSAVCPNASPDEIAEIFKEGLKEYRNAEAKAEALLQKTMKMLGVKEEVKEFGGETVAGYKVKGKMRTYFLTKNGKVYNYETGHYFCIVDRQHGIRVHKDKLVNRLLALANDKRLVGQISTLGK